MSEPRCPDCKHLVEQHSDFFCMHIKCNCNHGKNTAMAKYERDILLDAIEKAFLIPTDHIADYQRQYNQASFICGEAVGRVRKNV